VLRPQYQGMTDETPAPPPPGPYSPPGQDEPWAARFGLVRPRHGRMVAGVCAGIARATGTDPLLWRVLIGVLSIFGVGVILYLGAWLLTPAEGDTASPVEALLGRGYSSTSTGLTLVVGVIAVVCLGAITDSWVVPLAAIVALIVVVLANSRPRTAPPVPATVPGPDPATMANPAPGYPAPGYPVPGYPAPGTAAASYPNDAVTAPIYPAPAYAPPGQPAPGSYQPPFAPHGPYAGPPPLPPLPALPKLPKLKRERSKLGRLILGIAMIGLGLLGLADLAGASVPFTAYLATALAVVGIGLVIGAWFGRARGFIVIGIVLSLFLPIALDEASRERSTGRAIWSPTTVDEISAAYDNRFGDVLLDFSSVNFTGHTKRINVELSAGSLTIVLPPDVDATVNANIRVGDATIFGRNVNGTSVNRIERDLGEDGAGGGDIIIDLNVRAGTAEVTR
jgi:phage shock protein PspC (stress-responsive transcriptional regulator)